MKRFVVFTEDGKRIWTSSTIDDAIEVAQRMDPEGFVIEQTWHIVKTEQVYP